MERNLKGFTLAEVLITLGIIGVVAAITLPTVIAKYNKKAWVTQLQKSYSTLEQGFQLMLADESVSKLSDMSFWPSGSGTCSNGTWETDDACKNFLDDLNKYFKFVGLEEYGADSHYLKKTGTPLSSTQKMSILPDGAMVSLMLFKTPDESNSEACNEIKRMGGTMCSMAIVEMHIDVNGKKGPNTMGRDIFKFVLSNEGKLYPEYGKDIALYYGVYTIPSLDYSIYYWRNNTNSCGTPGSSEIPDNTRGDGCAARIMENGWKMDY